MSSHLHPLRVGVVVALSLAAMLMAGAGTAEAKSGMHTTLSLVGPCSIEIDANWHHPKTDQNHVGLEWKDLTTGNQYGPVSNGAGSTDTTFSISHDFPSGGPDVWVGVATLYDAFDNVLATATSKKYTFDCTIPTI